MDKDFKELQNIWKNDRSNIETSSIDVLYKEISKKEK